MCNLPPLIGPRRMKYKCAAIPLMRFVKTIMAATSTVIILNFFSMSDVFPAAADYFHHYMALLY